jgi:hypothetical protein
VFIAAHGIGRGCADNTGGDRIRMHIKQTCNVLVLKEKKLTNSGIVGHQITCKGNEKGEEDESNHYASATMIFFEFLLVVLNMFL